MNVHRLPSHLSGFIFDLDSTLYTNPAYAQEQIDGQLRRLADERGVPRELMRAQVEAYRAEWSASHGGQSLSLGNALTAFGVDVATSVRWREELIQPEAWLARDGVLRDALVRLSGGGERLLAVVSNNPVLVVRRTLAALGVEDLFGPLVGLDSFLASKPHRASFELAVRGLGTAPENCLAVGDRYDIDLALPLELGMGAVLVDGVEDVYKLPSILSLP